MANNDHCLLIRNSLLLLLPLMASGQPSLGDAAESRVRPTDYSEQVLQDRPVAYWRFETANALSDSSETPFVPFVGSGIEATKLKATVHGDLDTEVAGPRPLQMGEDAENLVGHLNFEPENHAVSARGSGGYLAVDDAGDGNPLAFRQGDTIRLRPGYS